MMKSRKEKQDATERSILHMHAIGLSLGSK